MIRISMAPRTALILATFLAPYVSPISAQIVEAWVADYDGVGGKHDAASAVAIDEAGMLRLTTRERTTRHIGNVLDEELEELWRKMR